jgi:hypothetical protein
VRELDRDGIYVLLTDVGSEGDWECSGDVVGGIEMKDTLFDL